MKNATGEAHITTIVIIIIGLVAAAGALIIPRIMKNLSYISCCNTAGGKWNTSYCKPSDSIRCEDKQKVYDEYESCLLEHDKSDAKDTYRDGSCVN